MSLPANTNTSILDICALEDETLEFWANLTIDSPGKDIDLWLFFEDDLVAKASSNDFDHTATGGSVNMGINYFGTLPSDGAFELLINTQDQAENIPVKGLQWAYKIYDTGCASIANNPCD